MLLQHLGLRVMLDKKSPFFFLVIFLNRLVVCVVAQRITFGGNPTVRDPPIHICTVPLGATHWPCKFNNMAQSCLGHLGLSHQADSPERRSQHPETKGQRSPPQPHPYLLSSRAYRGSLQPKPSVNEVAQSKGGDLVWINLIRLECLSLHSPLKVTSCLRRLEEVEGNSVEVWCLCWLIRHFCGPRVKLFFVCCLRCTSALSWSVGRHKTSLSPQMTRLQTSPSMYLITGPQVCFYRFTVLF